MGDFIQVSRGMPPWQPTRDSEMVAQLAYFDFPTVGIVHQHGADYLFRRMLDNDEGISFWAYTLVQHDEISLIKAAPTPDDFYRILDSIQDHESVTVVMVADELGIIERTIVSYWRGVDSLGDAMQKLVKELRNFASHAGEVADLK